MVCNWFTNETHLIWVLRALTDRKGMHVRMYVCLFDVIIRRVSSLLRCALPWRRLGGGGSGAGRVSFFADQSDPEGDQMRNCRPLCDAMWFVLTIPLPL